MIPDGRELWRPVRGFEGCYEISNDRRVKTVEHVMIRRNGVRMSVRERIRKQSVTRKGHATITLMLNGRAYNRCVGASPP